MKSEQIPTTPAEIIQTYTEMDDTLTNHPVAAKMAKPVMSNQQKVKARIEAESARTAKAFYDAALGRGKFKELDLRIRVALLSKAMDLTVGRARVGAPVVEKEEAKPEVGIDFQ